MYTYLLHVSGISTCLLNTKFQSFYSSTLSSDPLMIHSHLHSFLTMMILTRLNYTSTVLVFLLISTATGIPVDDEQEPWWTFTLDSECLYYRALFLTNLNQILQNFVNCTWQLSRCYVQLMNPPRIGTKPRQVGVKSSEYAMPRRLTYKHRQRSNEFMRGYIWTPDTL